MSQALLAIQNISQNSNIINRSLETVLFTPFGDKKWHNFQVSVSYLKLSRYGLVCRCSDHKYWSFRRNICNRFIESFEIFFLKHRHKQKPQLRPYGDHSLCPLPPTQLSQKHLFGNFITF